MSKKQLVPKYRFNIYKNSPSWKIKTLGSLSIQINKHTNNKKYILLSSTAGVGLVPQVEKFGKEIAGNSYKNYIVIEKNDFAYNKSATKQYPEGYIAMLKDYSSAAIPGSIFTCFRIIDRECLPDFFDYLFSINYHGKWLKKYISVGARAHGALNINTEHLWEIPFVIPNYKEQEKIVQCLKSVDNLILLEEEKLEKLKFHKNGLLQKLFPKRNSQAPEWRFKEFNNCEKWDIIPLRKLALYRRGSFPQPYGLPEWYDNVEGMPFIQVFDVDENLKLKVETKNKISKIAQQQSVYIPKGTIVVTIQGSIGRVAITDYDAYIDRTLLLFEKFYKKVDKKFIAYSLQLLFGIEKQKAPGGIIKTITKEVLSSFNISLPKYKEQQKIADCISSIDDLISAQTEKIEVLKQHKKGLLQGLFPSIEEVENE